MRTSIVKVIENPSAFKKQLLNWAQQFREITFLDSNVNYNKDSKYSSFDMILAVDSFTSIKTDYTNVFEDLHQYQSRTRDWLFGYMSYDLKNDIEDLKSKNFDGLQFPDLYFFQPKKLFLLKGNQLEVQYLNIVDDEVDFDFNEILKHQSSITNHQLPKINQRVSKERYIKKVSKMLEHIHRGDIYEANFCMEFFAKDIEINPSKIYESLNAISEPPFAVYFKNKDNFLISASPERYLKKVDTKIITQPIKGTAKRSFDSYLDEELKDNLSLDAKERSENIMIVDLVRNDLSHTATKGSVQVEELCQVYTFKQVHQMISTVVSEVEISTSPIQIIKTTFPMGSMTGAPKISAMQIIEDLEETKRGLYSGAVGYFMPNGDFDFNVVIRSILYNSSNQYLSFSVGSAITSLSIPENEYDECLLKAKAMFEVLNEIN